MLRFACVIAIGCGTAREPAPATRPAIITDARADGTCGTQPIDAKPLRVDVRGAYYVVTVDKGADDGVCERWSARLLGRSGTPYPFALELVELRAATSTWRFGATIEDPPSGVRLAPP